MKRATVVLLLIAVSGCAGMAADCGSDWYATGMRDARLNASSQAARYAARCSAVDTAKYEEGYAEGMSRRAPPGW
jgi:hypothetical protein